MSILNITNITNEPKEFIRQKFYDAFSELKREDESFRPSEKEENDFIENKIDALEELAEETLGKDLLSLVDNYLINNNYRGEILEDFNS